MATTRNWKPGTRKEPAESNGYCKNEHAAIASAGTALYGTDT